MKTRTAIIVMILPLLMITTSCKTHGDIPQKISINEFSSEDVPISCGLDSLAKLYGIPDSSFIHPNKKLTFDSLGKTINSYDFNVYYYPDRHLSYLVCNDSAQLLNIDLRRNNVHIGFRNLFIDKNTTMRQLNKLLQVSNHEYCLVKDEVELLGYSDYGYLLMYFGEEYPLLGSVDFYFDKYRKLIFVEFACPPGSIVYHSDQNGTR